MLCSAISHMKMQIYHLSFIWVKVPIYTSHANRGPGNPVILTHGRRHV